MKLKNFDIISNNNYLYFRGRKRHSSVGGGIISILFLALVSFFAIYFFLDIIKKANPTSFFYKQFIPDVGSFLFDRKTLFHYFQLLNSDYEVKYDPRYHTVIGGEDLLLDFSLDSDFNQVSHYVYGKCTQEDSKNFKEILTDTQFTNSLCIKKFYNHTTGEVIDVNDKDFIFPGMHHGSGSTIADNVHYTMFVMRCMNLSYNQDLPCKSEEEIEEFEKINVFRVKFTLIDNDFDVTQFKTPVIHNFFGIETQITEHNLVTNFINFTPVRIFTNDAIVFSNKKEQGSYRYDYNEKATYERSEYKRFVSVWTCIMQNKGEIYHRTYQKVQEVLANIGGASKAITIFAVVLNYLNEEFTYFSDVNKTIESVGLGLVNEGGDSYKICQIRANVYKNIGTPRNNGLGLEQQGSVIKYNTRNGTSNILGDDASPNANSSKAKVNFSSQVQAHISNQASLFNGTNASKVSQFSMTKPFKTNESSNRSVVRVRSTFWNFLKTLPVKNSILKTKMNLILKFWISQISEESLLKLHLIQMKSEKNNPFQTQIILGDGTIFKRQLKKACELQGYGF